MKVWAKTDRGRVRTNNEDAMYVGRIDGGVLLAVADGMGGHAHGEVASELAICVLCQELAQDRGGSWAEKIAYAFEAANSRIWSEQSGSNSKMGTTLTVAIIDGLKVTTGHVGDSRLYLVNDRRIVRLTDDHSLVGELEQSIGLSEQQAMVHPQRNILTRAIGVNGQVLADSSVFDLQIGDRLVLCTDGLTGLVTAREIRDIVLGEWENPADGLVDLANERGGADNITVVVSDIDSQEGLEVNGA